jgi:hypothetical protein
MYLKENFVADKKVKKILMLPIISLFTEVNQHISHHVDFSTTLDIHVDFLYILVINTSDILPI